jgi:hypothetical protein
MADLVRIGSGGAGSRDLFAVEAGRPDDVRPVLALPCPRFVCLLSCDATAFPEAEIAALARRLLHNGCVYGCCWDPDCERVHDLFDVADLELRPEGPYAMSACHAGKSLAEALWFFLFCSLPDEAYLDECRAAVAVTLGSKEWADEVRAALSCPEEFSSRLLSSEIDLD